MKLRYTRKGIKTNLREIYLNMAIKTGSPSFSPTAAQQTEEKIKSLRLEVFLHLSFSPDLLPSDFCFDFNGNNILRVAEH